MDGGTLYQLRNVINRRNITKKPTGNVTASEEYFLLVTEAHIVTAAMTLFQMDSLEDRPNPLFFPEGCEELPKSDCRTVFLHAAGKVLTKFVDLSFCRQLTQPEDRIQAYACEVLSLGLFLMEFNDAIREGMEHVLSVVGATFSSFSRPTVAQTMPLKVSHCSHSLISSCLTDWLASLPGVALLILMVDLARTFRATYIWNI